MTAFKLLLSRVIRDHVITYL